MQYEQFTQNLYVCTLERHNYGNETSFAVCCPDMNSSGFFILTEVNSDPPPPLSHSPMVGLLANLRIEYAGAVNRLPFLIPAPPTPSYQPAPQNVSDNSLSPLHTPFLHYHIRTYKLSQNLGIDSKESIPPVHVA
jgi:hypothetical protein